jgi:hypothetical protein
MTQGTWRRLSAARPEKTGKLQSKLETYSEIIDELGPKLNAFIRSTK